LEGLAVGGGGDAGCVGWGSGEGVGHRPCYGLTVRGVDTNDVLNVTVTLGELAILGSRRHVERAADEIITVLAVVGGADGVVACLEAELVSTDEGIPVEDLGQSVSIRVRGSVGEDDTTKRVTLEIGTVGVEFSSRVGGVETNTLVLDEADDLDVSGSLCPLETGDGTRRDETCAMGVFGAVCDDLGFDIANQAIWIWRTPETEVIGTVENERLAVGVGSSCGVVASVDTELRATEDLEGVDLFREVGEGVVERRENGGTRAPGDSLAAIEFGLADGR